MTVQRIEKPSDWVQAITEYAEAFINAYDPSGGEDGPGKFKVGKKKFEVGGAVGPDEVCLGVLAMDMQNVFHSGEPWPSQRPPSAPFVGSTDSVGVVINLRYVTCVPGPTNQGGAPPEAAAAAEQFAIMDLGWALWRDSVNHADKFWRKTTGFGPVNVGMLTRLPVQAKGSGFVIPFTCKLSMRC